MCFSIHSSPTSAPPPQPAFNRFSQRYVFCIPMPGRDTKDSNKLPQSVPEWSSTNPSWPLKNCVTSPRRTFMAHLVLARTPPPRRARTTSTPIGCRPGQPRTRRAREGLRPVFKGCPLSPHHSPARTATVKHLG